MEFQDLKVGDVVYGPLPHQDGWEKHYGVVLRIDAQGALVVSGTSRGVPASDDGLRSGEVVVRKRDLAACGLQVETRFDVVTHTRQVPMCAVNRLGLCGNVIAPEALARQFARAWSLALSGWQIQTLITQAPRFTGRLFRERLLLDDAEAKPLFDCGEEALYPRYDFFLRGVPDFRLWEGEYLVVVRRILGRRSAMCVLIRAWLGRERKDIVVRVHERLLSKVIYQYQKRCCTRYTPRFSVPMNKNVASLHKAVFYLVHQV